MGSPFYGRLKLMPNGRWHICANANRTLELTSGDVVEIFFRGQWTRTRIEHDGKGYYATAGSHLLKHRGYARTV